MALAMREQTAQLSARQARPLHLRIGINTGPVVAGVIGTKKFIYDLWGDTMNLASRMESHGVADGIQVAPATYGRLKTDYEFGEERIVVLKGHGPTATRLLLRRRASAPASGGIGGSP